MWPNKSLDPGQELAQPPSQTIIRVKPDFVADPPFLVELEHHRRVVAAPHLTGASLRRSEKPQAAPGAPVGGDRAGPTAQQFLGLCPRRAQFETGKIRPGNAGPG